MSRSTRFCLLVSLLIVLAACGGGTEGTATTDGTATTEGTETTDGSATTVDGGVTSSSTQEGSDGCAEGSERQTYGTVIPTLGNPFWGRYVDFQEVAAEQLCFDLQVIDAQDDGDAMLSGAEDLIARGVDGLVIIPYYDIGVPVFEAAEAAGVPVAAADVIIPGVEPQGEYSQYMLFIGPADLQGGYDEAIAIIEAMQPSDDGMKQIIAIEGVRGLSVNENRVAGLEKAVAEYDDVVVVTQLAADFLQDKGLDAATDALQGFPDAGGIWCSNDSMCIGAIQAAKNAGRTPGDDIIIGGLNGDDAAITAIKAGEMINSPAGHWLMGGFALAELFDAVNGFPIPADSSNKTVGLVPVDLSNVAAFEAAFPGGQPADYDFRLYSEVFTPDAAEAPIELQQLCPEC